MIRLNLYINEALGLFKGAEEVAELAFDVIKNADLNLYKRTQMGMVNG